MNISKYLNIIKETNSPSDAIRNEIILININRIFYSALIAMPVHFLHILMFSLNISSTNENEKLWRTGIILSHLVLFIAMAVIGYLAFKRRNMSKPNLLLVSLQYSIVIIFLLAGAVIAAIDQLVTTSITPFLIVCTIIGVIFLIKPMHSILMYLSGYIVYSYALSITQVDPAILLSNRVNGLTAVGIGICVSFILWKYNLIFYQQRCFIEKQQSELEEKNRQLEYFASYDQLTGLINRRHFEELIETELLRYKRYRGESIFLLLDIDYFKSVNDNYGHPVGDRLLKEISSLLRSQLRESDLLSRFGGEEFAVLLIHTPLDAGLVVAEKIRECIESHTFKIESYSINVTLSIGITQLNMDTNSFELIYKAADKALYQAKEGGRNRVELRSS